MLDGWYCRSMANVQQANASAGSSSANARTPGAPAGPEVGGAARQLQVSPQAPPHQDYSSDSSSSTQEPEVNYRTHYLALKRKLKYLIYENECFQDALRSSQRRLLKVSRDRTFLLDRLLQYERPETSSDSEGTESSDDDVQRAARQKKRLILKPEHIRKKPESNSSHGQISTPPVASKSSSTTKRKRPAPPKKPAQNAHMPSSGHQTAPKAPISSLLSVGDGHMTPEEVERHLQSRQSYLELLPERAPPTVPTEMFSNDPSLDSMLMSTAAPTHLPLGYRG